MKNAIAFGLGALTVVTLTWVATVGVQAQEPIDTNTITSVSETTSSTSSSTSSTSTTVNTTSTSTSSTSTSTVVNETPIDKCTQPINYPDMIGLTIAQVQTVNIQQFPECGTVSLRFWGYTPDGVHVVGGYPCVDGREPVVEYQIPMPDTATTLNELVDSGTQITWVCNS